MNSAADWFENEPVNAVDASVPEASCTDDRYQSLKSNHVSDTPGSAEKDIPLKRRQRCGGNCDMSGQAACASNVSIVPNVK